MVLNPAEAAPSNLRLTLYLTGAYALLGLLGLLLAMEPSNASPIFPAAGLGLAVVLVFGNRALVGIFLGDALSSLGHAWLMGQLGETSIPAVLLMAVGSCLRAMVGSYLIQRWQATSWKAMESERDAFIFIALGGLVSGAVGASVSVASLVALSVIVPQEAILSWWTWYLGDTLGIMLFAPLSLCFLFGQVDVWRERRRRLVVPMLIVFGLVGMGAWTASQMETARADDRLSADGRKIARLITEQVNKHSETLASLSSYLEVSSDIGFEQFERLARHVLQDHSELSALSFNEVVLNKQRDAYEARIRTLWPTDTFQITERNQINQLMAAGQRPLYVPVRYIAPLEANYAAIGYDVFSEPTRRQAVESALTSGKMSITAPIELVQGEAGSIGLLAFYPIHRNVDLQDPEHPKLKGFAVGVFKAGPMIESAIRGALPAGLTITLKDLHADPRQSLIYRSDKAVTALNTPSTAWTRPLTIADRRWELSLIPAELYHAQDSHWVAWSAGVIGLSFASLLQVIMLGMTGRTAVIRRKNRELQFLAYHDALTGLPNRNAGRERLTKTLADSIRDETQLAVLYLDLDNFQQVNDAHGHVNGDLLLRLVGERLGSSLGSEDSLCRLSGDEFMLVLSQVGRQDPIAVTCNSILKQISRPFDLEGKQVSISASIGVALYPQDADREVDADLLMRQADTALYEARRSGGRTCRFFEPQMNAKAMAFMETRDALRRGFREKAFELHYQPQFNLRTGRMSGVEALIRWRRADGRLAMPGEFITTAEESGLIIPIGRWVLHEACRQAIAWQTKGLGRFVVAVNLSAVQFMQGRAEQDVEAALVDSGLDPSLLELEITESLLLQNDSATGATLARLRSRGIQIALDDFGTGYSSLSYLKRFNVDRLKIDRSFVIDILEQESARAIVQAMIHIAQSLKIKTIAEGIEDTQVANLLRTMGCDEVQGYLYSRPLSASDLELWLRNEAPADP